jgi:Domain of unknown function (DUF222)
MLVDHLQALVDDEASSRIAGLDDLALVRGLLDQLEAKWFAELGRVDAAGDCEATGLCTSDWLARECRREKSDAQTAVRFAKRLRWLPSVADRFADGTLSLGQTRVITRAVTKRTVSQFIDHERVLFNSAAMLSTDDFATVMHRWKQLADTTAASEQDRAEQDSREAHLSKFGSANQWALNATLTAEQGEILSNAIDAIMQDDWERKNETRTTAQRRADAITQLGTHWLNTNTHITTHNSPAHIALEVQLTDFLELAKRSEFYRDYLHTNPLHANTPAVQNWDNGITALTPNGTLFNGALIAKHALRFVPVAHNQRRTRTPTRRPSNTNHSDTSTTTRPATRSTLPLPRLHPQSHHVRRPPHQPLRTRRQTRHHQPRTPLQQTPPPHPQSTRHPRATPHRTSRRHLQH